MIETHGEELVSVLLEGGFNVALRPHPLTRRHAGKTLTAIENAWKDHPGFSYNANMTAQGDLHKADLMISDWSGAALEFAFGRLRPVLFVDVPRKVNNPNYEALETKPLEVTIRTEIGTIANASKLDELPAEVTALLSEGDTMADKIAHARAQYVFNLGDSGRAGAQRIAELADQLPA